MSEKSMPIVRVLWLIRDACATKGAQREMMYALALRCNPNKKFICFPSYSQLAEDTQLDPATLKRAAKALEDKHLIKRVVRKNRSNVFYLNIPLLQEQVAQVKAAKLATLEESTSPFGDPEGVDGSNSSIDEYDDESLTASVTGGGK
jgi:DNA-binding MarR family transcriptional regulator